MSEVEAIKSKTFKKYVDIIGIEHFHYHSNHDSMFFLYEDFVEMMELLKDYENATDPLDFHLHEEFLYAAFLTKKRNIETLAKFKDYSYWHWGKAYRDLDDLKAGLDGNFYIMKRIHRIYDDPVRVEIRRLGGY